MKVRAIPQGYPLRLARIEGNASARREFQMIASGNLYRLEGPAAQPPLNRSDQAGYLLLPVSVMRRFTTMLERESPRSTIASECFPQRVVVNTRWRPLGQTRLFVQADPIGQFKTTRRHVEGRCCINIVAARARSCSTGRAPPADRSSLAAVRRSRPMRPRPRCKLRLAAAPEVKRSASRSATRTGDVAQWTLVSCLRLDPSRFIT